MIFRRTFLAGALGALALMVSAAHAADKPVVVGYQTDALPSSVGIANGDFEKATGAKIDFRRFNSGADIFAAIASGDVQVGYVGSSPFAAAASRGLDVKAFYLASISGIDEALVVRNGSGINSLADLKGKKLAAAPVSTDHYQLLALIKSLGLNEKDVQVFAVPQPEIVAAIRRNTTPCNSSAGLRHRAPAKTATGAATPSHTARSHSGTPIKVPAMNSAPSAPPIPDDARRPIARFARATTVRCPPNDTSPRAPMPPVPTLRAR